MKESILKKMYQGNVELSEIKVDLAMIDDLKNILNKAKQINSEMVDNYVNAQLFAKKGIESGKIHLKNLENVSQLVNDIKSQADLLGLDISKVKEWRDGFDFLSGNSKSATEVMIKKMEGLK
jgi:translation initiation factor 2 alpha subunit (eIF-2alpha)